MPDILSDYRNHITTVDDSGKRKWIYALQPAGKLYRWRTLVAYLYLAILVGLPFIRYHGEPLFLLDFAKGKFIFFGQIFLPQDFILFGLAMLCFLLFIIVFTLIFGRIFCGWICPQTIFMEMVFRKIEYWIEGSATHQMNIDRQPWTMATYLRKALKHLIFFGISFLIANVFLSYIIGIEGLYKIITDPFQAHWTGLLALLGFSIVFYGVFAYVRELVCTVICPYGRLQSVLLDKNSIVVSYDYLRGEPRAKVSRARSNESGDCIDCDLCVKVCPTGIDIRNGTQMECTNCTACIDACNMMMKKTGKRENLIRYASENAIQLGQSTRLTGRIKAYSFALLVLLSLTGFLILSRPVFDITIMRVAGQAPQMNDDGTISNLYRIKIINKSSGMQAYRMVSGSPDDRLIYAGKMVDSIKTGEAVETMFFVKRSKHRIKQRKEVLRLEVFSGERFIQFKNTIFIGEY